MSDPVARALVDRATFFPVGQYDDGSLTLAWPGFLKDAWDGAQRSYLDATGISAPDTAGGKWSSNVDALNAASIGPMGGVIGRMAGAIPRNATGVATTDLRAPPRGPQRRVEATDWEGNFGGKSVFDSQGGLLSYADLVRRPDGVEIGNITSFDRGKGHASALVDDLFREYPDQRLSVSPMTAEGQSFFSRYGVTDDGRINPRHHANPEPAATPALVGASKEENVDPVTQALMSQGAAGAQQPDMNDPMVRALLGVGGQHQMPDDIMQLAQMSGQAAGAQSSMGDPAVRGVFGLPPQTEFETLRQRINAKMSPVTPPEPPQSGGQTWREWANEETPQGLHSPLARMVGRGVIGAYDALPEMEDIPGAQDLGRSLQALGRMPGDIAKDPVRAALGLMETGLGMSGMGGGLSPVVGALANVARNPGAKAAATGKSAPVRRAVREREAEIMKAPPHTLQKRGQPGNKGQFRKFDPDTRKIRDKAIEQRARRKSDPYEYDPNGEPLGTKSARDFLDGI